MEKKYTIEQIKKAFWEQFHGSGELWFPYFEDEEENQQATMDSWEDFLTALTSPKN